VQVNSPTSPASLDISETSANRNHYRGPGFGATLTVPGSPETGITADMSLVERVTVQTNDPCHLWVLSLLDLTSSLSLLVYPSSPMYMQWREYVLAYAVWRLTVTRTISGRTLLMIVFH
jgi:hypothetical protein